MSIHSLTNILLVCLALFGALTPTVEAAGPLIFRLEQGAQPPSYLVGTMHTEDPRVLRQLGVIRQLIRRVDSVAVELIPDALATLAIGAATLLPPDRRLRDQIGPQRFAQVVEMGRQRGLAAEALDRLRPWAVAVLIGMPIGNGADSLDMQIYLEGQRQQRELRGLETVDEQLTVFTRLGLDQQLELLDEILRQAGQLSEQLEALTRAYLSGDLAVLERLANQLYADMPGDLREWFDQALIVDRNRRMADRLVPMLSEGSVLVAVGALHLGGNEGLIALLRAKGFRVTAERE